MRIGIIKGFWTVELLKSKKMRRYFVITIIALGIISCDNKEQQKQEKESVIPVTVSKSIEKEFTPEIEFSGTAFANKEANLGTAIPGRVEKIHFNVGEHVKKGDLIVELSSELYTQALIERNTLQKDFERVSRLRDKESLSEQDYDHVKAKYEATVAKTEMMKKNSEIVAPFAGTVVDHIVKEGENYLFAPSLKVGYSMTSGIIKLMQLDVLNVEIDVNEKEISKIKKGQKAEITFDAYPDKKYTGTVESIEPILSTLSRTVKVKIKTENKDLLIKPGMYSKVKIKLPKEKAVFVPIESIYRQPGTGNDFVFVVENNVVKRIPVTRKYTLNELAAVDGIKAETTIAVGGKSKLIEGIKVEIKE